MLFNGYGVHVDVISDSTSAINTTQ